MAKWTELCAHEFSTVQLVHYISVRSPLPPKKKKNMDLFNDATLAALLPASFLFKMLPVMCSSNDNQGRLHSRPGALFESVFAF